MTLEAAKLALANPLVLGALLALSGCVVALVAPVVARRAVDAKLGPPKVAKGAAVSEDPTANFGVHELVRATLRSGEQTREDVKDVRERIGALSDHVDEVGRKLDSNHANLAAQVAGHGEKLTRLHRRTANVERKLGMEPRATDMIEEDA